MTSNLFDIILKHEGDDIYSLSFDPWKSSNLVVTLRGELSELRDTLEAALWTVEREEQRD